ncbi:hypothetical protein HPB52_007172 [Rhipicephalus sanguineus]|uniref:Uncharacterized protein n=1 Tax=Rhipicephalus sanguineus TaxID=34632 RepID=A0A9D4Q558_RHISA|nr:hypothetical protein HPB52_007172 [Rhipicephalus sanguineus]
MDSTTTRKRARHASDDDGPTGPCKQAVIAASAPLSPEVRDRQRHRLLLLARDTGGRARGGSEERAEEAQAEEKAEAAASQLYGSYIRGPSSTEVSYHLGRPAFAQASPPAEGDFKARPRGELRSSERRYTEVLSSAVVAARKRRRTRAAPPSFERKTESFEGEAWCVNRVAAARSEGWAPRPTWRCSDGIAQELRASLTPRERPRPLEEEGNSEKGGLQSRSRSLVAWTRQSAVGI